MDYFYEKRYMRGDGEVYVKRYTRSFPLGKKVPRYNEIVGSNVKQASVSRAKSRVRILAFSNPQLDALLTLTFRGEPDDSECSRMFDLYRRAVRRRYPTWQFLGVRERQKRGVVHYHLLVNFCPDMGISPNNSTKFISESWTAGFSDFSPIKGDNHWKTELYLLKYLGKDMQQIRGNNYVRSKNLNELDPRMYDTKEPLHPLAENIFTTIISNNFVDKFYVTEYNYSTTLKRGANYVISQPKIARGSRQKQ